MEKDKPGSDSDNLVTYLSVTTLLVRRLWKPLVSHVHNQLVLPRNDKKIRLFLITTY